MIEKQQKILDMAKDICRVKLNCNDVCNPISACDALRYAERAVEAGYVKQSEGHWISAEEAKLMDRFDLAYTCSVCGHCDWDCTESETFNFCPNCGAKMKGGADNV